eukprot:TRINITY_DN6263_c0_g1_i2.p1 TRINITY_DN6263_c0_g1~~TRINITY_DN6263_c0_g1_i2.p1  ORF type:complete len:276 (-),score=31.75 TRINITY_DN6263_c0_g1_i2:125-952(-)
MVDQIGSAHLDLDILEDEDQFRHRLSFWIRKSCFIFVLAVVLTISVSAPSMHRDLAFWALLCDLVYYSLDIEAPLNGLFIVATHPISFVVSFISLTVGGYAMIVDDDLVRERAETDNISVLNSWVLHVCLYWLPMSITFVETFLSRSYLQRRYGLFLTWPIDDATVVIKILWSVLAAPMLIAAWYITGNRPSTEYQAGDEKTAIFWLLLVTSNVVGSTILILLVKYRSEYEEMNLPPVTSRTTSFASRGTPRWSVSQQCFVFLYPIILSILLNGK